MTAELMLYICKCLCGAVNGSPLLNMLELLSQAAGSSASLSPMALACARASKAEAWAGREGSVWGKGRARGKRRISVAITQAGFYAPLLPWISILPRLRLSTTNWLAWFQGSIGAQASD